MRRYTFINFKPVPFHKRHSFAFSLALCLAPALSAGLIALILRLCPAQTVERLYSSGLYNGISAALGFIAGLTVRSLASYIWMALALAAALLIGSFAWFMIKGPGRLHIAGIYLRLAAAAASAALLLFAVLCMPNYYRLTFAEKAGITLSDYTVTDLEAMCLHLIEEANARREAAGNQTVLYYSELAEASKAGFDSLGGRYPFLGAAKSPPKPVVFSQLLSRLNLTGFYFPYTGEANVNVHMPPTELPFTMCHELAHTRGFMREDEANYIGFLACMGSEDDFVRYSGLYSALAHSMNALYAADAGRYRALREQYSEGLSADFAAVDQYWRPYFDTPAADLSNAVNDAYLKANDLPDGIKSYGRMVDLLMAEFLSEGSLA